MSVMKRELFFVEATLCTVCMVSCQPTPKGEMAYPHKPVTSAQVPSTKVQKVFEDGILYILRNGEKYDATGKRVSEKLDIE